jgi:hypothetical protein
MTGIEPTLAAAAIVALTGAAIVLLSIAADLPRRAQLALAARVFVALAGPGVCAGAGFFLLLHDQTPQAPRLAAAGAAAVGLLALAVHTTHLRTAARVRRALGELATTMPTPPATIARLVADLPRVRPPRGASRARRELWVRVVFESAQRMMLQSAYVGAIHLLDRVPPAWLEPRQLTVRDNTLALCRMRVGDLDGADEALTRAETYVHHDDRAMLATTRAMLLLVEQKPSEALGIVGDDRHLDARTRLALLITRAHAHAALGDEDAARVALSQVTALIGRPALERALAAYPGAASKLSS